MPTRILTLAGIMMVAACAALSLPFNAALKQKPTSQAQETPTPSWLSLDTIKVSQQPENKLCGLDGDAPRDTPEAAINQLMNRYHLPDSPFDEKTLESLLTLPQGEIGPEQAFINFPAPDSSHQQRAVSLVGYVTYVSVLGCGPRPETKAILRIDIERPGTQSSNCRANKVAFCDTQILIAPDRAASHKNGRNIFVLEVTPRSRLLAGRDLLTSNIGKDWSVGALRKQLVGHRARISGWLFFDQKYMNRSWSSDPADTVSPPNARQTAWEIHPVMGIEVLDPTPLKAGGKRAKRARVHD